MITTINQLRIKMSRVKKAVLFLVLAVALLLITMPVNATGSAKFGLTQINSDSTTLKLSVDHEWDNPLIDFVVETDYVYKEQSDVVKMDKFSIIGKANKEFYKLNDSLNITNKLLNETGTDTYLRNETAINYSLTEKVSLGFSNTYTEDPVDNNVLSVTIGVKW